MLSTSGSRRGARGPGLLTHRFGGPAVQFRGPSVQFESKIMNFRALVFIFSKKFPALLHLASILYFFHILLVSICSVFYLMCILLHYIDSSHKFFLSVKTEVKYFCIHYYTKMFEELINIFVKLL